MIFKDVVIDDKKRKIARDKQIENNKELLFEFMLENNLNHNAVCIGAGKIWKSEIALSMHDE